MLPAFGFGLRAGVCSSIGFEGFSQQENFSMRLLGIGRSPTTPFEESSTQLKPSLLASGKGRKA